MKATSFKIAKNFLAIFIAATFLTVSITAHATGIEEKDSAKKASVTYLGTVNAQPIFQVEVENTLSDELTITLENTDGDVLYKKNTGEAKFVQKIQLQTTDTDIEFNLIVYSKKTKQTQVYYINKMTKVVDDMVVNQVRKY